MNALFGFVALIVVAIIGWAIAEFKYKTFTFTRSEKDIEEEEELEEQRRMEQMPKGSVLIQLEWATQKSQIENQQRKKNKTKYKGLEI